MTTLKGIAPVNRIDVANVSLSIRPPLKFPRLSGIGLLGRHPDFAAAGGRADHGHEGDPQAPAAAPHQPGSLVGFEFKR
jgi:hypothetical protein